MPALDDIRAFWRPRIRGQVDQQYPIERSHLFRMQSIHSLGRLLGMTAVELRSECESPCYTDPRVVKRAGEASKARNINSPVGQTLRLHYRLLELLDRVGRPHYLHSATRGRSYITNAKAHARALPVLTVDIQRFFESTTSFHLTAFFQRELQMPADLARMLTKLCTSNGHLPLGSPLSPLLSYFAHRSMFDELNEFCADRSIRMTVYVDDLTFSGLRVTHQLLSDVRRIICRGALRIHGDRARFYPRWATKEITGVMVRDEQIHLPPKRYLDVIQEISSLSNLGPRECALALSRIRGQIAAARNIDHRAAESLQHHLVNVGHAKVDSNQRKAQQSP